MNSKKICFFFSVVELTGAGRMGFLYAQAFKDAGYEVFAICGEKLKKNLPYVTDSLKKCGIPFFEEKGFRKLINPFLILRCARLLKREKPVAVVSVYQMEVKTAGWACWLAKVPFIVSAQNMSGFHGNAFLRFIKKFYYGVTLRRTVQHSICTSQAVQKDLADNHRFPQIKTSIVPNGIETANYKKSSEEKRIEKRNSLGLSPNEIMFLNVGRLDRQKGQHVLFKAWKDFVSQVPHAKLFLVGDTTGNSAASEKYTQELKSLISHLNIEKSIIFLGWRNDVGELLGTCDCYIHSAIWEGWPLAVMEAMASAAPTIMTDCVGYPQDFENGRDGFVVVTGQEKPLLEAMLKMVQLSHEERWLMGQRGQQIAQMHYDFAVTKKAFVMALEKALL